MKATTQTFRNLITNSMNKNQILKTAICILVVLSTFACKKETAATRDTIKPHSTIQISGGGFSKTFDSDSSYVYGQLNLKPNTKYNFMLTARDTGGLRLLQLQMLNDLTFGAIASVTAHTESTSGLSRFFTVTGTPSDPYTSFFISGSFTTQNVQKNEGIGYDISSRATDYSILACSIIVPCFVTYLPAIGYGWIAH